MMHLISSPTRSNTYLQVSAEQNIYVVPMNWYISYIKYKKGGPSPGPIILAPLLTPSLQLNPECEETIDYKLISQPQWTQLSKTFGKDYEIKLQRRAPMRSVSSGGYEEDTFRSLSEKFAFPTSARKSIEAHSELSSELYSKPASLDKENANYSTLSCIKPKVVLGAFENSNAFNSCLLMLFCIQELAEFFFNTSSFGDCYASEFLFQVSLIFIAAWNMLSGVIRTEFFFRHLRFGSEDPGQIFQILVNKLEVETCNSLLSKSIFDGMINKSIQCLVCGTKSVYSIKYSYLILKPAKSLSKSFEQYSRHMNQVNFCSTCNKEQDCCTQVKVVQFPVYFIVILKRWEADSKGLQCSFKSKWNPGANFRLISVISEVNKTFVNFSRRKKNWLVYEGEHCKKVLPSNVFGSLPYVLLYKIAN